MKEVRVFSAGGERIVAKFDPTACEHCIWEPEHYREDGSCKCNDPNDSNMDGWGYAWDPNRGTWVSPYTQEEL